ncbi:unnamed protein product [Calypogeia fissa]
MANNGGVGVGVAGGGQGAGVGGGQGGGIEGLRFSDLVTGVTGAGGAKGAAEWTDVAVATFLECFAEKYAAVKHKNLRGKDWKEVVDNLNKKCVAEGGPYFEYKQCRNKLDGLKKRFRQEKESLNANLQPSKWQWYSRMCELRGRRNPRLSGGLEKAELDLTEGVDNTSDSKDHLDGGDGLGIGTPTEVQERSGTPPFCSQNEVDTASPRSKPRANLGKKTRKRRRSHMHTPPVSDMIPGSTNQQVMLWPGENQRKPLATDRTYKLKIKRAGEEDFEDLFHLTGDTVQDLIDSFKAVYWEEENTQVRVQLKDKSSDAWVTVAPSVSLSQYGMEAQIIIKPQGFVAGQLGMSGVSHCTS